MSDPLYFVASATVVLDLPIDLTLTYGVTKEQYPFLKQGLKVEVFLNNKKQTGYVIEVKEGSPPFKVKPIHAFDTELLVSKELFTLARWISQYYFANFSEVFRLILPPPIRQGMAEKEQLFVRRAKTRSEIATFCQANRGKKKQQVALLDILLKVNNGILLTELLEKSGGSRAALSSLTKLGWVKVEKVKIDRSPLSNEEYFITKPKKLNEEQQKTLEQICQSLKAAQFCTHLVYGVTGSGKTEVYLQAIDEAVRLGKGVLMLVPEIALTGQTIERFRCRFKEKMAILHHRLSQGERRDEWHHIHSGRAKIVIGARSAIFSPIKNLGLIILDEEHDASYKQSEKSPCYQARDVAVMRGKLSQATVVLGSATPSLDSYYNAIKGKYLLSTLHCRADRTSLPLVTLVDMKKEREKNPNCTNFSEKLLNEIEKRLKKSEQIIIFLNRRGYHTNAVCQECREVVKCHQCDLAMTFHLRDNLLACHLCGHQIMPPPRTCKSCKKDAILQFRGAGTEQIERALHAIFPQIRTLRMDADTTKHKGSHQKLLRQFGTGKADLLIGTQMIAKGLHFSEVTLVGVINGDAGLHIPDFRAAEKTFQLMTQVAGRSGRGVVKGEVIIQTYCMENSTIRCAAEQDYLKFFKEEMEIRKVFCYPPFSHLVKLTFAGKKEEKVVEASQAARELLIKNLPAYFEFLPVVPCGYAKVKELYRFQFLCKSPSLACLSSAIHPLKKLMATFKSVRFFIDVDPSSTFF